MKCLFDFLDNNLNKLSIKKEKIVLYFLIIATIIATAPILLASFYNFPCADDFAYGMSAYKIAHSQMGLWEKVMGLIQNSFYSTKTQYMSWSGCYTSYIFSAFNPFIFSEKSVFLTTFSFLTIIISSIYYLLSVILKLCLKMDKTISNIAIAIIINLMLQFIPSAFDAFYWFNGSFYNTIGYSAGLVLMGIFIKILISNEPKKLLRYLMVGFLLTVFVGGTNYSTILVLLIVFLTLLIDAFLTKKISKKQKASAIFITISLTLCFIISVSAPGNSIRAEYFVQDSSILSIFKSYIYAFMQIKRVINIPILIGILVFSALVFNEIKSYAYRYRYPIIVIFFVFSIYAATFTPVAYAQSAYPELRLVNIQYWLLLLVMSFNIIYLLGWFWHNFKRITKKIDEIVLRILNFDKVTSMLLGASALVLTLLVAKYPNEITGIIIAKDIGNGRLQQFSLEMKERTRIYQDANIKNVIVKPLSVTPNIFIGYKDISEEQEYEWIGSGVAACYDKESVKIED